MTNQKFENGAFMFTRARGLQPRNPDELLPLAAQHNLPPDIIPNYAGDRATVGRAISQTSSGLHREGFLLRPVKRSSAEVIYGIIRENKEESSQKLKHEHEATVSWSVEPDSSVVQGDHSIARRVAEAYRRLQGKIVAEDWSASITTYLEQHDAARVRGDGRVYWVPPQRIDAIRNLGSFLQQVGIGLILCELEPEVQGVVQDVASESIEDQLTKLQEEADSFDGTQRPSTYVRRLDEYQRLKQRAVLYRDALGVGVDKASQVLQGLEEKVGQLLDIRKQTVIPRGKSEKGEPHTPEAKVDRATDPSPEPSPVPSLQFAGTTFNPTTSNEPDILLFTSGDEYALASIASLENLGLTGKWQNAGSLQVSIQNSGPPGAEVSIRVRCPSPDSFLTSASSLASLGISITN